MSETNLDQTFSAASSCGVSEALSEKKRDVLILGIGNILWADEGFGPRAAEAFHERWIVPENCSIMDGGTLGGWLIDELLDSKRLLVFDCCDFKSAPGTLKLLRKEDIRIWASTKISPHQSGFNDLLATTALMGHEFEDLAVVGVQPKVLDDYGGSLSELVRGKVAEAIEVAHDLLEDWGVQLTRRSDSEKVEPLSFDVLQMDAYESGRPDEKAACRVGDERFLVRRAGHASSPDELS